VRPQEGVLTSTPQISLATGTAITCLPQRPHLQFTFSAPPWVLHTRLCLASLCFFSFSSLPCPWLQILYERPSSLSCPHLTSLVTDHLLLAHICLLMQLFTCNIFIKKKRYPAQKWSHVWVILNRNIGFVYSERATNMSLKWKQSETEETFHQTIPFSPISQSTFLRTSYSQILTNYLCWYFPSHIVIYNLFPCAILYQLYSLWTYLSCVPGLCNTMFCSSAEDIKFSVQYCRMIKFSVQYCRKIKFSVRYCRKLIVKYLGNITVTIDKDKKVQ